MNKKLPYIYFKTKSFHVYLRLWKLDDEWIGVSYSVRTYNSEEIYQGGSPLSDWYHDDLTVLLNGIDELMITDEYANTFEPLDDPYRSEEHTSELQSRFDLVCRLLLEKKK